MRREQPDEGRGQFNRQRESVEPEADLGHGSGVGIGDREVGLHGLRPLNKEAHGLVLAQPLDRRQMCRVGYGEWL